MFTPSPGGMFASSPGGIFIPARGERHRAVGPVASARSSSLSSSWLWAAASSPPCWAPPDRRTVPPYPGDTDEVHAVVGTSSLFVTSGWDHVVGIDPTDAAVDWKWPS